MLLDRDLWRKTFREDRIPEWKCPTCGRGTLQVRPQSLLTETTAKTKRNSYHENWEPDWDEHVFVCILVCDKCLEAVTLSGTAKTVLANDAEDPTGPFIDELTPQYMFPASPIIPLPANMPASVVSELQTAFSLFWADPSGAVNRVRVAIEFLMNALGIPKKTLNKKKFSSLTLHGRIEEFKKRKPKWADAADKLLAVKWLGNAGSHAGDTISHKDLLDSLELLADALEQVYDDDRARLAKTAKKINKQKGPVRKKGRP